MEYKECPKCGSKNIYEDECGNISCIYCESLFTFCNDCDWSDHKECEIEELK